MVIKIKRFSITDLLLMLLYMSLFLISSESINGNYISLFAAALAILIPIIGSFEGKGRLSLHVGNVTVYHVWLFVFIVFCYVSSIWAIRPSLAITKGNSILKNSVCVILIYIYYSEKKSIKDFLRIIMYGGYAIVIFSILFFGIDSFNDILTTSSRLNSDYLNQNTLGMLSAFTIIINLYFILYYKEGKLAFVFAIISMIVIAAAGSRKSILELGMGIFLLIIMRFYSGRNAFKSLVKIIISLAIVIIIGYFILRMPMFDFVNTRLENVIHQLTGTGNTDYSVRSRALLNELGINIFLKHPFIGIGIDCARIPAFQVTGEDWYLHNNYIELLADGGIVGFCLFYSIYAIIFVKFIKYKKYRDAEYDISLILMVVQFILGYAYVSYYSRETYFYLLLYFLESEILKNKQAKYVSC